MSRIPRKNISTPFLHIMIQGNNKNYILKNNIDKEKYLKIIKETMNNYKIMLIAYCIMENHVHLLFYEKDMNNLSEFMHKTNQRYAQYYNKKYDKVGHVFRDRYKVQPIMSEKHLAVCIKYIHNNPVNAGLCQKASDYKYSSNENNIFFQNNEIERKMKKYLNNINYQVDEDKNDFVLLEDDNMSKEKLGIELIDRYLKYYKVSLCELKENRELLIKIIKNLKNKYNISYRIAGNILEINRETIRKLIKNNK